MVQQAEKWPFPKECLLTLKRPIVSTFLTCLFLSATGQAAMASEHWYETGKISGYPTSKYMTALGYGATLHRARMEAARNLADQIDSDIHSKYEQSTSRDNLSISRTSQSSLTVKTHAKLYGIINIKGTFVSSQGSYVALVGVKRESLVRYLTGRIRSLEKTISQLKDNLDRDSGSMRRIHDLSGIVLAKEKAAFFDREVAVVSEGSPSDKFDSQKEIDQIETLLSRDMTVTVSVVNACGKTDSFARHVRESIEQNVNRMGLLVVPSGGKVRIAGQVSASPMNAQFSRRYRYYILHYALSMSAPDGTVWGSVVRAQKIAGLNPGQAELLASRTVSEKGVGPLLSGLKSRLFMSPGDPQYVSFPSETSPGSHGGVQTLPPEKICQGF